jgi:hypothetical protein
VLFAGPKLITRKAMADDSKANRIQGFIKDNVCALGFLHAAILIPSFLNRIRFQDIL